MLSLRRLIALVLLVLWLPATSHCAIETVLGVVNEHCEAVCSHEGVDTKGHPANDACATVEDGAIKPAASGLHLPPPTLSVLACLDLVHAGLLAAARPLARPTWSSDHPDAWVPARHVASRAVAPARAPNLN